MLDFVLNLLIFFIITAVFTKELAIQMERSGAVAGQKEAGSILISISAEGEVTVDNRLVDVRAVRANVERLHALKPDYGVMVVANQDSRRRRAGAWWPIRCAREASRTSRSARASEGGPLTCPCSAIPRSLERPASTSRRCWTSCSNLLIFFIITTSFVKEAGVEVSRADAETAVHREKGNILIAIRPNGEIWMDRQQVDIREVRPMIERLHVERPDDTVIIVADKASKTGLLASVMDAVRAGGIPEVAVAAAGAE